MSTWHALITWSQCTAAQFFDQSLIAKCTQVNKISHIENKTTCQIAILFEHSLFKERSSPLKVFQTIEAKTAWVFAIIKRRIDIISLSSKLFYWFFLSLYPTILNVQQFQQNNLPNISDVSLEIWWDSSLGGI